MKFYKLKITKIVLFLTIMLMTTALNAENNTLNVEQLYPGKVDIKTFRIEKESQVNIYGKGAKLKKRTRHILCYGWIIDAKSGRVIWNSLKILKNKFLDDTGIFSFEDKLTLQPGIYKAYYTSVYDNDGLVIKDFGDLMENIFSDWDDDDVLTFHEDELRMIIKGSKNQFKVIDKELYYLPEDQREIAGFLKLGNDAFKEKGFSLKKETTLFVTVTGEKKDRKFYDYGRIYDMKNHRVVWPTDQTIFEYAGGGWKNVTAHEKIVLPPGNYKVSYVSDDSHSFNDWNVLPPNNPEAWGIRVNCLASEYNHVDFSVQNYEPVVDLMKAGNNAILTQGMELKKDLTVRVICLGEIDDGEAYDYGWIENALTNEIVWKFDERNSEHAGGGSKNWKFNGLVSLEKGKYIVKFISDGSHSYFDWNTTPPFEKEYWGISVWLTDNTDRKYVELIEENAFLDKHIIVKIDKVGDYAKLHKDFNIDRDGLYRVYAIGEGDDDEMYDTGWIKRLNNNQVVWEMTWRNSRHAGGARKNRMFNNKVYLTKGEYRLYYETDGSHSFSDWNDTPPTNPDKYGIRIMKEEK